ncbi:MAG: 4-hydroxy-tetrahydrodipicolinate reductase [Treponema sp.]|jgi:4-hydroxy-tetrahydrodipicolinate reductase|nr:4-hydroxy-tetrahydrodipicolinate reductase [Treponema sp.]
MNIAIIGYGKMGKFIESLALEQGYRVVAVVDPFYGPETSMHGAPVYRTIPEMAAGPGGVGHAAGPDRAGPDYAGPDPADRTGRIDVALEFTRPDAVVANIKALAERRIPVVVGSTGWQDRLEEVEAAVRAAGSSLLWAPNFSLGVNLFYRIVACAAMLMDGFTDYDVAGYEIHHNKKADSPSGTAKMLVEIIMKNMGRKTQAVYETLNRPPRPEELHYGSLRLGAMPGTHTIVFDSPSDSIEITHRARNREGLVRGALMAARWLLRCDEAGPVRQGVFTFDDVLADSIGRQKTGSLS